MVEKESRTKILDEINRRIAACFGKADLFFANHPYDEKEAKDLRKLAFDNRITLNEITDIAREFLEVKSGCHTDHVREQMEEVNRFFAKKLKNNYD